MFEFIYRLFDTSDFPARWYCGNWSDSLGWLHIVSDLATWGAYTAIPIVLLYYVRRRQDFPFHRIFFLFAIFIMACGSVHLVEAVIFWQPIYRVSGLLKLATAIASWCTVLALVRITPTILHYPSLAATNEMLNEEIARRTLSEENLRKLQARYEALLAGTRSIVWTCDAGGKFKSPQLSWQRYTGQTWEQHAGTGWLKAVAEDDRERIQQEWLDATSRQQVYRTRGRLFHLASDSYRPFILEAVPVHDSNGHVSEWVGTISDIYEQYMAEEALRLAELETLRQKRELELIYDTAPVGMCLVDRNFKYVRINETLARYNGVSREQHFGKSTADVLPKLASITRPLYQQVFDSGEPIVGHEICGLTLASSEMKHWLVSYYPIKSDNGQVWAISSIIQDITDRKRMEQALRDSEQRANQANLAKSQFLANMSHEIRTPMAAILGYADVLLSHMEDPDDRGCVQVIQRNGNYLLEIINDILDLSRIEAGRVELDIKPFQLPEMLEEIHTLMQVRADQKKISLRLQADGKIPRVISSDATRIRQILINLVGNAIKFTNVGSVELHCKVDLSGLSPIVRWTIIDTGIGISDEQKPKLFQPFSQGDDSVTRDYGGSGLGLVITKRFVEMLGGSIAFTSVVGEGTTFVVEIPCGSTDNLELVNVELSADGKVAASLDATSYPLSCRVLVVDDRRDVRFITQHVLEAAGATVHAVEDGESGLAAARKALQENNPYDVIVMDMQMPKLDGKQATRILRSEGVLQPIIALTADAMKGDCDQCLLAGCDAHVAKPIQQLEFVRIIYQFSHISDLDQLKVEREKRCEAINNLNK